MNWKNGMLCLFVVVSLVQIAVPLSMIAHRERTLIEGEAFRFKTAPVDPYDAFRGRYVALRIEQSSVMTTNAAAYRHGQTVYALLEKDQNDFSRITGVSVDRPHGRPYVTAEVGYSYGTNLNLNLPFDRYYMSEDKAPKAESAYRRNSTRTNQNTFVTVRVMDGFAVLEELYIGGMPIKEYIEKEQTGGKQR
jgi:uncharacterized membrane-anchored protein